MPWWWDLSGGICLIFTAIIHAYDASIIPRWLMAFFPFTLGISAIYDAIKNFN